MMIIDVINSRMMKRDPKVWGISRHTFTKVNMPKIPSKPWSKVAIRRGKPGLYFGGM